MGLFGERNPYLIIIIKDGRVKIESSSYSDNDEKKYISPKKIKLKSKIGVWGYTRLVLIRHNRNRIINKKG